jgi:hypothetical protein
MTTDEVREFLRQECEHAGSQAAWAKANGMAGAYVSDVIHGRRDPAKKLLAALKLKRVVSYVPTADVAPIRPMRRRG